MSTIETNRGPVEIRELRTIEEMVASETLQTRVWGMDTIPSPKDILIPTQHEGGLLAGAFAPDGELVGMVFGFPTRDPSIQHSHILATLAEWRGQGIGARLKWFQRDWCLERGITLVRWTVDPLRAANAALNIGHLGGVASTYFLDYYGAMTGIDAGAPTDRLLVEWRLNSERVAQAYGRRGERAPDDAGANHCETANPRVGERSGDPVLHLDCLCIRVCLPGDFVSLAKTDPPLALDWRLKTRAVFQHYFAQGYCITGFTRSNGPAYLLTTDR